MYSNEIFIESLNELINLNLSFEAWQYHHQINQVIKMAETLPDLKIVLNHFSGPIGIGPYANKKDEIFEIWKKDITQLAKHTNVYAKLGGLAMPINGYEFHKQKLPPTSDQIVNSQRRYYDYLISCFGPERCMFESNFPVDKQSVSYNIIWNAFKKMSSGHTNSDKDLMFFNTAESFYKL
jgi:predicted TIM-barrel fold metal-dependent hydrolase